jgi:hypothetical protein
MKKFLIEESGDIMTLEEFINVNNQEGVEPLSKDTIDTMENMESGDTIGIGHCCSFIIKRVE